MWFPTISWLPSSVKNLTAKPRTSRTVSALPLSPPVLLRRNRTGVFFPTPLRNLADVREEILFVTSNSPHAPAALAWTTLFIELGYLFLPSIMLNDIRPFGYTFAVEMRKCFNEKRVTQCCEATTPKGRQRSADGWIRNRLTCLVSGWERWLEIFGTIPSAKVKWFGIGIGCTRDIQLIW